MSSGFDYSSTSRKHKYTVRNAHEQDGMHKGEREVDVGNQGKDNAGEGDEDEDETDVTYLSKLFHEDGVPEQL